MTLAYRDLSISFGERQVVALDELRVESGEILGLVGESGSGKSMTATAALGLAPRLGARVSGSIALDGEELLTLSPAQWAQVRGRRIAMIFQNPSSAFNPVMKVGDVFARTLKLHGETSKDAARERSAASLHEVLLPAGVLDRYPHQLSGGQIQRVAIALALALDVQVLLADEATSALDVTVQAEILTLLSRLKDRGIAILLITHDLGVVAEVADRVAVMQRGCVVETGETASVLGQPSHVYTRSLIDAVPRLGAGGPR